jgi:hypothetical protein
MAQGKKGCGFDGQGRKADLAVGTRWGRLTAVGMIEAWKEMEYEKVKELQMMLKCDCGKEITVWESEWKGKKRLRDCGCGLSTLDGVSVIKCVSLPVGIWQKLKVYADQNGLTVSKAYADLILKGVEANNQEVSNGKG